MKRVGYIGLIACSIVVLQACNHNKNNTGQNADSSRSAKDTGQAKVVDSIAKATDTTAKLPTGVTKKDTGFAYDAASGGLTEVELGKAAEQRGSSADIKNFGAMMVQDHSKANDTLAAIARKEGIMLPNAPTKADQQTVDALLKLNGKTFDKAYKSDMINDHQNDIKAFEYASKNLKDSALRAFAATTLPVLKKHLKAAHAISLR